MQETVRCSRCDKWFQREKEDIKAIKKSKKVDEFLCPECDAEIQKNE